MSLMGLKLPIRISHSWNCVRRMKVKSKLPTAQKRRASGAVKFAPTRASARLIRFALRKPSSKRWNRQNRPANILPGNDAHEGAMAKLGELRKDFSALKKVARAADFPKGK